MTTLLRSFLTIITIFALGACGFTKGKEAAIQAADKFHQQYNGSKFAEIYADSTPAFKSASTEADFLKFIQAVHHKLGPVKSSKAEGWRINTFNGTTSVVLGYETEFAQGNGTETFTFLTSGTTATLQGYNVNSTALITN